MNQNETSSCRACERAEIICQVLLITKACGFANFLFPTPSPLQKLFMLCCYDKNAPEMYKNVKRTYVSVRNHFFSCAHGH